MSRVLVVAFLMSLSLVTALLGCAGDPPLPTTTFTISTQAAPSTQSVRTAPLESATTTTTLGPGEMSFATLLDRFNRLIAHEDSARTLPYTALPAEELAWLRGPSMPFEVTDAHGYRLANGDLVVLFFLDPPAGGLQAEAAAAGVFAEKVYARLGNGDSGVWPFADDHYGYVVVSRQNRGDLGRLAQWARSAHEQLIPE